MRTNNHSIVDNRKYGGRVRLLLERFRTGHSSADTQAWSHSINKLCSMSGVTQSTVNNIVSGRNNSATISTIKKLCDGLGITIQEFFASSLFAELEQEVE